jgi:5-methyltetrahydrofolate--homocysteine methyltransferase
MTTQDIFNAVLAFDEATVTAKTQAEIDAGTDIGAILNDGLISAMDEVGERFSAGELFVPEMLMAAQAMKAGLALLKPHLAEGQGKSKGVVVIGTVKGDLHDIGKNLVSMMMEGAGFEVVDLGVDVDSEKFVKTASEKKADVIALSALLTTTMPSMESTVKAVKEAGMATRTIIGGAPVTQAFADQIGADGYSADAPGAVKLVKQLVAEVGGRRSEDEDRRPKTGFRGQRAEVRRLKTENHSCNQSRAKRGVRRTSHDYHRRTDQRQPQGHQGGHRGPGCSGHPAGGP